MYMYVTLCMCITYPQHCITKYSFVHMNELRQGRVTKITYASKLHNCSNPGPIILKLEF